MSQMKSGIFTSRLLQGRPSGQCTPRQCLPSGYRANANILAHVLRLPDKTYFDCAWRIVHLNSCELFVSDDEVTSTGPSKPCYLSDTFQQESFKYSPCFYGWSVEKHLRIQGLLPNNNKNSNESSSSSSLSSLMLMGHVAWTTLLCSGTVSACTR